MAVCDPTISNIMHEGTRTIGDSTSETNSIDTGSEISLDKNSDDSICHDIRGSIRRSPRSLNQRNTRQTRNAIKMEEETFDSRKYSSPHIHLNKATIDIITKKEHKIVSDEENQGNTRKSLEDQILAETLMKSVVENTDRLKRKVEVAREVSVNTIDTGCNVNNNSKSESRVGVTLNCDNMPLIENQSTHYLEVEENSNLGGISNVFDDSAISPGDGKKDESIYSGVYCGTRKRKRDASPPESPLSMGEPPAFHREVQAPSPIPSDNDSRLCVQETNNNLDVNNISVSHPAVVANSQKPPDVSNSSVPNPILGSSSLFKNESDSAADKIMRQNSSSVQKDVISMGNNDAEQITKSLYSNVFSRTIPSIKIENPTTSNIVTETVSSQYSLISASTAPKNSVLPDPCPIERREHDTAHKIQTHNNSTASVVLPNNESFIDTQQSSRPRIFSIDFDSNVFDFDTGLGVSTQTNGYFDTQSLPHLGAKLDPNSTINRAAHVISENHDPVQQDNMRERGMSFELFSFGLTADEPLPPTQGSYNGEVTKGWRIGESNIFDPVSFTDGGIHEETALSKSRPISMILEENDEIELMNTPGFVEGPAPQSNCQMQQSVPNPVFSHPGENRLPNAISESSNIGMSNDLQFNHNTGNVEVPLKTYSSTAMKLHNMSNTENHMFASQDNPATSLLSQVHPSTVNGTVSHSSCAMELLNKGGRIGIYLPVARKERIAKFHSKRKMRIWRKRIKYDCRKKLADSRPRIKGRFVKSLEQDD